MNDFWLRLFGLNPGEIDHVTSAGLQFRNAEALGWLVFVAMLLALGVWWVYWKQEAHRSLIPWRRQTLAALRMTLLVLILLLLLRPVLALGLEEKIRRTLLILVDSTRSMSIRDQRIDQPDQKRAEIGIGAIDSLTDSPDPSHLAEASHITRADLVKAVLQNPRLHLLDDLRRNFNVETFLFGQTAVPVEGPSWLTTYQPSSNSTAIGDAVNQLVQQKRGQPLAGIFLITDGGNNAGVPPAEAAGAAARDAVPIYAYGVGITSPRDIIVSHISAPELAFAKDQVAITVQVRGQGLAGQTGHLSLKLGDTEVVSKDIVFTGADELVPLAFTPPAKGDFELTAAIPPRHDEITGENNSVSQHLRVIDSKIRVLYIEQSPRWEFRFLQQALLRDQRIAPSFILLDGDPALAREPGSPYLPAFPETKDQLFKYDMVIVGDVDPKTFSAAQVTALSEFVSKFGGACLFIAGRNFMPDAYRGSDVEKMLPVEMQPFHQDETAGGRAITLALTPLGAASEMLRLAPDETANVALWAKFPPIYWDQKVARAKPAAQVLITDPDPSLASQFGSMPVFASQQYGVGQVFYMGTDDLWRWRRGEGVNEYPRLWGQIVQGAALAHLLGSSRKTQLSIDKQEHEVGDQVTIYARLYSEGFLPITDSQVAAQYTIQETGSSSAGEPREVILRAVPEQPGMYRGDFVALKPGRYRFSTARDPATTVEFTARVPQFELGETAMNEPLLKQIAAISGGRYFREENLSELSAELNRKPETLHTSRDAEIWSSPFYFLLMCMVVVSEWILRKKWNLK